MPTNARLDRLADNPFSRLTALLSPIAPAGNEPPILMSLGDPQHEPPALVAQLIAEHAPLWNRYPPMAGTPAYRAACARWLTRRYRLPEGMVDPERHVLSLSGTKEGLFLAATLAVPERKRGRTATVLMPNPYYLVYNGAATLAGAEIVYLDATKATGFLPDLDAIPADALARCALFYLCSPANPQGAVADIDYLAKAIALARDHDFVLVVDECYGEIYDRVPPPGALEACAAQFGAKSPAGGMSQVLVFHSLSKRSSAAGMRCGFVAGDPALIAKLQHLRSYGGSQVPLPIQVAAAGLWDDEDHVEANRARYRRKLDIAQSVLGDRFGFYRPQGGFFLWLDVGDGERAALALWRDAGIRTLPGAYIARCNGHGDNPGQRYIRVALVHDDATVAAGLERMRSVL